MIYSRLSDVKNYVFDRVTYEIIMPRIDNAASFIIVLIAFLENIGTDEVTRCAQGSSTRVLDGTKRPDEQNMQTCQAIQSCIDGVKTLASAVYELNLSYKSIAGTLMVNSRLLQQVMMNMGNN